MAKDHYVAQTYLKHFKVKGIRKCVNAIRKSNLEIFKGVNIQEICQKANWSNSPYHQPNPRMVEDYLKVFEPRWNECITTLRKNTFNIKTKSYMAGYLAFLRACTPKAVRLSERNLQEVLKMTYKVIAQQELNKNSEHAKAIRKIESLGGVNFNVDEGYSKGMTFQQVLTLAEKYIEFQWSVLFNQTALPFLTSDNPVCIDRKNAKYSEFYIPITPTISLIIHPHWAGKAKAGQMQITDEFCDIKEGGVHLLNELLVKNAEDMIIFNHNDYGKVMDLVKKYQNWHVENRATRIPTHDGHFLITQEMVVEQAEKQNACAN